jgi:hypothetical protein
VASTVIDVADKRRAPLGDKRDGLTADQGPGLAPKNVPVIWHLRGIWYSTPTRTAMRGVR